MSKVLAKVRTLDVGEAPEKGWASFLTTQPSTLTTQPSTAPGANPDQAGWAALTSA